MRFVTAATLGPRRLALAAAVGGVIATTLACGPEPQAHPSRACHETTWGPAASIPPSVDPQATAYYLWHGPTGWRLVVAGRPRHSLAGVVIADARVTAIGTHPRTGAIRRIPHGFRFARIRGLERISFRAPCARRLAVRFGDARAYLGDRRAPARSFVLRRPPATGVAGRVIAGPTCPIVVPDCPLASPVPSTVQIAAASDHRESGAGTPLTAVATDRKGSFAAELPPGAYMLTADPTGGGSNGRSVTVQVSEGVITEVTLAIDTGIR